MVERVGHGGFVLEIHLEQRVAEVMGVKVVLEVGQLGPGVGEVALHHGEQLVELAQVGLCEVEGLEIAFDFGFGDEL